MFTIDPKDVELFTANGTANMGDVTSETSICRWTLTDAAIFVPVYVRAWFDGGTGSATCQMRVAHRTRNVRHNFILDYWLAVGTSGKPYINTRYVPDEWLSWQLRAGDYIVFEWTNPDANNMSWGLELALIDAAKVKWGNAT